MNSIITMQTNEIPIRITPQKWDEIRLAFHRSLMMDTPLASLAQNIDGCVWPLKGADEKPSTYVDLELMEVVAHLEGRGAPATLVDNLADILRGTLAFDQSFGAMVNTTGEAETRVDPMQRNLVRLGIPVDFPLEFCNFSPGTTQFCVRENLKTLIDFLAFSRGASRQVIVGGEFRDLLNAVVYFDEQTLARLLPFRPKDTGLHLVEAIGLLVRPLDVEERIRIARAPSAASAELRARVVARVGYFHEQAEHLRGLLRRQMPMARLVVSLDDLSLESAVAALLGLSLSSAVVAPRPGQHQPARRRLLDRLFNRRA